jgi:phosphatidylglycerol lysyltransferase
MTTTLDYGTVAGRSVSRQEAERIVARWGRAATTPFITNPGTEIVDCGPDAIASYVRRGRWAVTPGDPVAPPGTEGEALDTYLCVLRSRRLSPAFVATTDAALFQGRGLVVLPVAEEATIALGDFSLDGKPRAGIRHSMAAARRLGLKVVDWHPGLADGVAAVSRAWLATKRGGEMGFTLGAFSGSPKPGVTCRVIVSASGEVLGFVTWHDFDGGHGRVLDVMRRQPAAPNPTMDYLIGQSLVDFAAEGVEHASLSSVPLPHGALGERIYPAASLRHFKAKFAPRWETRWLAVPSRIRLPGAMRAVALAYCPDGLRAAIRHNG